MCMCICIHTYIHIYICTHTHRGSDFWSESINFSETTINFPIKNILQTKLCYVLISSRHHIQKCAPFLFLAWVLWLILGKKSSNKSLQPLKHALSDLSWVVRGLLPPPPPHVIASVIWFLSSSWGSLVLSFPLNLAWCMTISICPLPNIWLSSKYIHQQLITLSKWYEISFLIMWFNGYRGQTRSWTLHLHRTIW